MDVELIKNGSINDVKNHLKNHVENGSRINHREVAEALYQRWSRMSVAEAKKEYKQLMRELHPDMQKSEAGRRTANNISAAINDARKKKGF